MGGSGSTSIQFVPDMNVILQLQQAQAEQARLQESIAQLQNQVIQNESIQSEIDLNNQKVVSTELLYKLSNEVSPLTLSGSINIGLFGVTSAGKSSIVNSLIGEKVAETGVGETTRQITSYNRHNYTLFDFPGLNDDVSYFDKEQIGLMKGLTHRLVVITATVKEVKRLLNLFEAINVHYDILINKFDAIDFEERTEFQQLIKDEICEAQLRNNDHVWCISAKNPQQFPDWLQMVQHLTIP